MLEDVVRMHLVELSVGERPREFAQVVDDIHAGQGSEIVIQPTLFDDVAAAKMEFCFGQ